MNGPNGPSSDDKLWAGLCYAGLVCCMIPTIVIFLLKRNESNYIKFHGLQAMAFWLGNVVLGVIFGVLGQIPGLGILLGLGHLVLSLGLIGYWVYLMIQAFTGKDTRIPVLADWLDQNLMT